MGKKQYLADDIASDLGLIEPKQSKADLIANDLGLNQSPDINLSNNLTLEPQASLENKVRDILKSVDSSDAEKEHVVSMALKGAPQNEISDAILTIQGKHPKQEGGYKYYLEESPLGYKKPIPISNSEKPLNGNEVISAFGTQNEAEDDSRINDIAKKIYNVLPSLPGSINDLVQVVYGSVAGDELPWYQTLKNSEQFIKLKTSSKYDKGIINTQNINSFSDLLKGDSYDFSPSTVANTATQVGQSVLQFIATRGAMGAAGKGANSLLRAGKITEEAAKKAIKVENYAKGFSASYLTNLGAAMDAANELGVTGRDAYLTALAVTVPVSALDMLGGGEGAINKAFQQQTGKNLVKNLVAGAIKDADGNITKEVLDDLYKTANTAAATIAEKTPKSFLKTTGEESVQEVGQNVLDKTSQVIHDNLVDDEQSKYGTEMFSPQSVAEYLNDAFGGLIGGAQGHVLSKALKKKESEEEKSKTIMSAISNGNENELKTQLHAARKSGQISEEDLQKGLFKIDRFIEYEEATKDRGLDPENRRKIFDLTYEKANVNTGIEHLEENNVDGINDGEIKFRKDHVKEIDGEIDEIFKGAEEKAEKEKEPITKAVKDFKFNKKEFGKEEKDVPSFNVNEMSPDEFEDLDPVDKFHAIWQATNDSDKFFKPKELNGTLEIPIGRSAKINVGGKLIDLASSDQDREVVRNGEKVYPNEVLQQYNNEAVTIRPTKQGHYKTLSVFDKDGHIIKNLDGEPYLIRASEKGYGRPKYNSSEFIHPEHIDEYEKGSEGLIKVADFETRNLGREFEGETESPEAKEILKKSILNPYTSWKHGEKYIDFAERAIETYKRWLSKAKDKSLIVTHGPVISLINQWEKQGRPKNLNELDFKTLSEAKIHPEEISEHASDNGKIYLVRTSQGANINDAGDKKFKLRTEPLTPEGEQTAVKVGQALKPLGITDVISSTLKRAKDTAIIIKKTIDGEPLEKKPKNPIVNPNNIVKFDKGNGNAEENTTKRKAYGTSESVPEKSTSSSKTTQGKRSGNTLSKERRKIKSPLHLKALSVEVFTPFDLAQQYFIRKGNVSPDVIRNLFKGSSKEIQYRISLIKKGAPNSEQIGELLVAENDQLNFTDVDYKNAVEDVLRSFHSRSQMATDLIERNSEKENYNESEEAINDAIKEAEKFGGQDILENIIGASESLTEEEFKNISEGKKSFDDFIDSGEDIFTDGDEPQFQKPKNKNQTDLWGSTSPEFDFTEKPEETKEVVTAGEATKEKVNEVVATPINKIEDYGEKIGGAKKDLAKKLSEITAGDIAGQPLSKSFPKPDYKSLVEQGIVTQEGAIMLKFLYDNIPSKPRMQHRLNSWVRSVQSAINTIKDVIENERTKEINYTEKLMELSGNRLFKEKYKLYSDTLNGLGFPTSDINLGNFEIKKFQSATKGTLYTIVSGHSIVKDYPTMEEAINGLKAIIDNKKDKPKETKFDVYKSRKTGDFFIGKKGAKEVITLMNGFKSAKEAFLFLADKKAEVKKIWEGMKINPEERRISNEPRKGIDWRKGKSVDSEGFGKTFGFRGVEFGNWVNDKERQTHVNEAYDSLMDLASVLNISPKGLSLDGQLGLAFGARGGGKALAHYENEKVVINLTKTKGAGSLAHEWWHALDNYFSRKRGFKDDFLTQNPRQRITREGKPDERVRKDISDAFKAVMDAIGKTELRKRSEQIDATKSKAYWSTTIEMSARSFENYIIEKLGETNQSNDYLANFKETSEWIKDVGLNLDNYPYPLKDESPIINEAFDNLFSVMEEKVGESGNVELFQKPQKESQQKAEQEIVDKVIQHLKKANPKLSITYDSTLKAAGMAQGNKIKINPFYAGTDTPIHEVAHILIDSIGGLNNRVIAKAVEQLSGTDLWNETVKRYPELSPDMLAKEVLAEAIGREGANIFDTEVKKTYFRTLLDYIFDRIKTIFGINRNIAKSLAKEVLGGGVYNKAKETKVQLQKPKPKIPYKEKTRKIANKIVDTKDLEGYTNEQLIEIYNRLISDKEFSSKNELKEAGKRIAYVLFRNRKTELNKEFGDKFVEAQANKTDLSWKDVRLKVLSHVTENFPELQELSKYYDKSVSEMQEERYDKKSKLESLGKEVIKEGNKELGLIGKAINYFYSNNAKYFDYLDNNGKMLTVSEAEANGLSEAKIKFLKFMRELLAEREELESNEDIYNSDLEVLKTNKEFQEAFKSEGALTAFNNYLGKGYQIGDVRIEYTVPGTTEKKIDSLNNIQKELQEYAKKGRKEQMSALLKTLKYTFKARKQFSKGVNADEEINPLNTFQSGDFQINPKGELTSKYDKPYKGESYSKDFYRAAMEYIDDTTHVKHMGKVLPIVNAIDYLNREGLGEHTKKPNTVKWINEWRKTHIFKEKNTTTPYLDSALKFLRFYTSTLSFAFNYPAGLVNIFIGLYHTWRAETDAWRAVGHRRLYGNLKSHNIKKGLGLINPYAADILEKYNVVSRDFDSNPKLFAGKLFDMMAFGANRLGEYDIQGAAFLGMLSKEEYNSFEYKDNKLVVKDGLDEKALRNNMNEYKNRVSNVQGKYSDKDKRNIMNSELGKTAFQFKVFLPDYLKERFGEKYITRDNKIHQGSWMIFTKDAIKDLKADIKEKGIGKAIWENKSAMQNLKGSMFIAFLLVLKYSDDDDEETKRKQLSLDSALSNVLFIYDPNQLKFLTKQPISSLGVLNKFANTLGDMMELDSKKLSKDIPKIIPYKKTVESINEFFGDQE